MSVSEDGGCWSEFMGCDSMMARAMMFFSPGGEDVV